MLKKIGQKKLNSPYPILLSVFSFNEEICDYTSAKFKSLRLLTFTSMDGPIDADTNTLRQ